jgi:hypothetical protein
MAALVAGWLFAVLIFHLAAAAPVHAGIAFGLRAGYADVDGDAFVGSGKIGGTPLLGLQAIIPIVPLISLVVAGEQRTKRFDFANASIGDLTLSGRAKWTDQALYAAARARLPGVIGLYGGAGVGMHRQQTNLSGVPRNDFINQLEKEATDLSWHAFAGLECSVPAVPVAIFGEGRIDDIQGSAPHSLAAYAGFNLKLP